MPSINDALLRGGQTFWAGSRIVRSSVQNTGVATDGTQVTVPAGTSKIVISVRTAADFWVWILPAGSSTPSKSTPTVGFVNVNGGGQARFEAFLDPGDNPEVWVAEGTGVTNDFDIVSQ